MSIVPQGVSPCRGFVVIAWAVVVVFITLWCPMWSTFLWLLSQLAIVMEDVYLLSSSKEHSRSLLRKIWHTDWCPWLPARYVIALMTFLGIVNVYALRVNLSMALVVMVNDSSNQADMDIQPHAVSIYRAVIWTWWRVLWIYLFLPWRCRLTAGLTMNKVLQRTAQSHPIQ